MSDLVERLRERKIASFDTGELVPDPLCMEAADRIEALEADLKRASEWRNGFAEQAGDWGARWNKAEARIQELEPSGTGCGVRCDRSTT